MAEPGETVPVKDMDSYQLGYKHGYDGAEILYKEKLQQQRTASDQILTRVVETNERIEKLIATLEGLIL